MGLHAARSLRAVPAHLGLQRIWATRPATGRLPSGPSSSSPSAGRSPSSARHPPLHCTATTAFSVDSDGRFHPRRARFGSQPPTHSLYSHPMAHRGFVLFIAGPVRGKQRSTIATKAPPGSFQITTLQTRRPPITREGIQACCSTAKR